MIVCLTEKSLGKEKLKMYKAPEMEVTLLEAEDILTVSGGPDDIWEEDGKGDEATGDDEL